MNYRRILRGAVGLLACFSAFLLWRNFQPEHSAATSPPAPSPKPARAAVAHATPARSSVQRTDFQFFSDAASMPQWTVKFGDEFWRHPAANPATRVKLSSGSAVANTPFNVADVVDRVNHALTADATTGLPEITAKNYFARVDEQGLHFSPYLPAQVSSTSTVSGRPQPDPTTEMSFRTVSVQRDEQSFFSADRNTVDWSVAGDTAQGLLSSGWGVVEHYEPSGAGVAVTWVFPQPLPGNGPIQISAAVDGMTYAGATDAGHHFADSTGMARVCVGQAFAVDSLGNRWALDVQADNSGKLLIDLPAQVQTEAVYPLAVDPIIGAEFGMDQPVSTVASGDQNNAAIASSSSGFFVVWEDNRNSSSTGTDIYGARVSNAGAILDLTGIAISTTGSAQNSPAVALSGNTFLVVWRDGRLGGSDIFGARVSNTGAVLDPLGVAIDVDPAQNTKSNPAVAANATGFMVVWQDNRNSGLGLSSDIYGARVTTAGAVLDPTGFAVCSFNASQANPTITTNSAGYFVAWEDNRNSGVTGTDIYGARVATNGVVLDTNGVPITAAPSNQIEPAAAANGSQVLLVWRDRRNNATNSDDIYGARLNFTNNTLNVLDPTGIPISTNTSSQRSPAVCALTNNFLVVWRDRRNINTTSDDIYAARLDTNGVVLDPSGIVICNDPNTQTAPAVAANASGALVVWTDSRNASVTGNDIYGARVSLLGVLQDANGIAVGLSGNAETAPAVAFNGTNYLVVWQDDRAFLINDFDIRGTRVSGAGAVLDSSGINICTQPAAQANPSVGASGGEFLVAWEDSRNVNTSGVDIYGTRVSNAGTVLDPAGLALSTAANDEATPVVGGNQSTFLVVWQDNRNNNTSPDLFGTLVSQAGGIVNPAGLEISATGGNEINPAIAGNASQFLVVWEDTSSGDVFGARVTSGGVVLDTTGNAIQFANNGGESKPSVGALGNNFLVAWMDSQSSFATGWDIYATRVLSDGSVPDFNGFPVCTRPNDQINPTVSSDGSTYVVAWENVGGVSGNDLYSARINAAGSVLDVVSLPLAGAGDRTLPQLAYGGGGKFLLVSDAFRTNSTRVVANVMTPDAPVANLIVQFSSSSYSVAENGKVAKVTVTVTGKYSGVLTVDFATMDGTAVAGVDYMATAGRLVFSAKKTSAVVLIPIIDDGVAEPNKTVQLLLQNPTGGVLLGLRSAATLTIME